MVTATHGAGDLVHWPLKAPFSRVQVRTWQAISVIILTSVPAGTRFRLTLHFTVGLSEQSVRERTPVLGSKVYGCAKSLAQCMLATARQKCVQ